MILTKTNALVNSVLYLHANPCLRQTEIVATTGAGLHPVQVALETLGKGGVVRRETMAGQTVYRANQEGLAGQAMRLLALQTLGTSLVELLGAEINRLQMLSLVGSLARNTAQPTSDLDLLLVGRIDEQEVSRRLRPLEQRYGRQIDLNIMSTEDFRAASAAQDTYLLQLIREQFILWGTQP